MTATALFTGLIDYAGLFPPARLPMDRAVAAYATHRDSDDAWMLGRFVVPAGRLDEMVAALEAVPPGHDARPWPLSVLTGDDAASADAIIEAFTHPRLIIEAIETKASTGDDIADRASRFRRATEVFIEIPYRGDDNPTTLLGTIADHARSRPGLAAKIRTGGITTDAFPSTSELVRFLSAAQSTGAVWKATAGLHHALRGEYPLTYEADSARGTMHSFLGLFTAAAFVHGGVIDADHPVVVDMLETSDGRQVEFDAGLHWRDANLDTTYHLNADQLATARTHFARGYGSCSFDEPTDELRNLHLIGGER
ncbi:MAG: hypothetical protein AAGD38_00440 [Acidobacteriota bacterium]